SGRAPRGKRRGAVVDVGRGLEVAGPDRATAYRGAVDAYVVDQHRAFATRAVGTGLAAGQVVEVAVGLGAEHDPQEAATPAVGIVEGGERDVVLREAGVVVTSGVQQLRQRLVERHHLGEPAPLGVEDGLGRPVRQLDTGVVHRNPDVHHERVGRLAAAAVAD